MRGRVRVFTAVALAAVIGVTACAKKKPALPPMRYRSGMPSMRGPRLAEMPRLRQSGVEIPERTEYTSGTESGTPASGEATAVFSRGVNRYQP